MYEEIQAFIKSKEGYVVKTCWIAHVKELNGLPLRTAHNRHGAIRTNPCPPEKRADIEEAFRHFGML